jgi:hypothetical protein
MDTRYDRRQPLAKWNHRTQQVTTGTEQLELQIKAVCLQFRDRAMAEEAEALRKARRVIILHVPDLPAPLDFRAIKVVSKYRMTSPQRTNHLVYGSICSYIHLDLAWPGCCRYFAVVAVFADNL